MNHLANRALDGPDQCAAEMACVDGFPLDDVAEDSCSRSSGNLAACDATVGELGACFSGLATGYVENAASFGCPWILGDDRTTRPLPISDACASLPAGCRALLGFGP